MVPRRICSWGTERLGLLSTRILMFCAPVSTYLEAVFRVGICNNQEPLRCVITGGYMGSASVVGSDYYVFLSITMYDYVYSVLLCITMLLCITITAGHSK